MRPQAGPRSMLALLLLAAPAGAGSVSGTVVEHGTRRPLFAAEVVLRRAADSTVVAHASTGADGRFRLESLPLDRYLLRASLLGHQPLTRADVVLTAAAPDLDLGTLALTVSPIAIPGAQVSTARATAIVAPDRNIYLTRDMPSASTGTAAEVMRTVPELDVDLDGNVSLRGSKSITIQFNGRPAPMKGDALATYLRQMPASRIERVEVIANPSAKFDPEGTGGIVNIVLKDNVSLGLSGSVNLTAGQRYSSPGARVAWQEGKVTFFGGAAASLFHYDYDSDGTRRTLLTTPPSALTWATGSRYQGRYGMFDASADVALDKRNTLYATLNGTPNDSDPRSTSGYAAFDSTQALTRQYDRVDDTHWTGGMTAATVGWQQVVQGGKDERTLELMQTVTRYRNHGEGRLSTQVPSGAAEQIWEVAGASGYRERALQADDTHPLGARGKLETGYRIAERRNTSSSAIQAFAAGAPVASPFNDAADYSFREVFHSGYVTLGSTFGHLSVQAGARAELARTTFDVFSSALHFDHDYRSLFPSANLAWDFGRGRNARLSYSKRIERPTAMYLNPDVPATDSLNRFVGNPALNPRYTHLYGLDASWSGSRGTLRVSPYLRRTVDNWDVVTRVDASGVATSTYLNASSVRTAGVMVVASLRQTARLGGNLSAGVSREHHDAGNVSSDYRRDVTGWSASGNLTFKTTSKLDLQGYLRYAPPRALAQGRASAYVGSSVSARYKIHESASASLALNDPFNLSRYWSETGDATFTQRSDSRNRMRSLSASLSWTWGKPPEQKQRRQKADAPPPDAAPGGGS